MQGIVPSAVKPSDDQKMVNNAPPGFNEAAISRGEAKRRPFSLVKERLGFPSGENAERETAE